MKRRAFTLIELLVALVIGVIVMIGVFVVFQTSSAAFRSQNQTQRMNDELRGALMHLKADLKKAAFLSTPNSAIDPTACLASEPLQALALELSPVNTGDAMSSVAVESSNAFIQPMALQLLGPYPTTRTFRTAGVAGNQVTLLTADTLETRANYPATQAEFEALFQPGRLLKIVNQDQLEMYVSVQDASFTNGAITIDQALQPATADNACGYEADGSRMEVVLLSIVRYRLGTDLRVGAPPSKTDLIREEMRFSGHSLVPVDGTQLRVAEYVVDLMLYDFLFDVGTPGAPNLLYYPTYEQGNVLQGDGTGKLERGTAAVPEKLRFVTIKVSARTPEEDPALAFSRRSQLFGPLRTYEVLPTMTGAAAVESLATRVELTTFRQRGL